MLGNDLIPVVIVLTLSAALAYALLAIEYALFTTAITVFVVLLTDSLGAAPLDAAGERALGTRWGSWSPRSRSGRSATWRGEEESAPRRPPEASRAALRSITEVM